MRVVSSVLVASAAVFALVGPGFAQDTAMQSQDIDLPEACQTAAEAPAMPDMQGMQGMESTMQGMGDTQQAYMAGMMATQDEMTQGIMAEDPDVAFACGMMAHHQAAINMAQVELDNGDNDQIKQMAQKIIEDQQREIDQFKEWLEAQGR